MRKALRKTVFVLVNIAVLLTMSISATAIGFDAETAYDSVFVIYSGNNLGSGFAIGQNCIVSNAHVIGDSGDIKIQSHAGDDYTANIVAMDKDLDIVILQVADASFPYLTVADYNKTAVGEDVYAIGAPDSMAYTLTKGVLSAKDRTVGNYKYIQIDAAVNSGNSGGPLLTDGGKVIGVNTLKVADTEGIGLSIPMTTVCELLTKNDITLDQQGNVVGIVSANPSAAVNSDASESVALSEDAAKLKQENFNLKLILIASVIINVLLAILLLIRLRKFKKNKPNPNERTDFEIDILG